MLDSTTQLAIASTAKNKGGTPLTFITGLKYNADLIKALNNMTFLFDPNWEYEKGNPTYPIAFFYVKSMTETMETDISQRPMLFYNSATTDSSTSVAGGLMNVVTDNIVIKPKTYKLEVIVPANITDYMQNSGLNLDSITYAESFLMSKDHSLAGSGNSTLSTVYRWVNFSFGIIKTLFTALYGTQVSASSIVTMLLQQQDYNKASLEYMWRSRRVLKLKVWTGWKFKYLAIKSLDINKTGVNGGFYEGTVTCQEMPIMTFAQTKKKVSLSKLEQVSAILGKGMKVAANTFIKAMEATAGD